MQGGPSGRAAPAPCQRGCVYVTWRVLWRGTQVDLGPPWGDPSLLLLPPGGACRRGPAGLQTPQRTPRAGSKSPRPRAVAAAEGQRRPLPARGPPPVMACWNVSAYVDAGSTKGIIKCDWKSNCYFINGPVIGQHSGRPRMPEHRYYSYTGPAALQTKRIRAARAADGFDGCN